MSHEGKEKEVISRRKFLYTVGGLAAATALGWGLAGYFALAPKQVLEKTVTKTQTQKVTTTVTKTVTTSLLEKLSTTATTVTVPSLEELAPSIKRFEGETLTYMCPPWGAPSKEIVKKIEDIMGIKLEVISIAIDQLYDKVATASAAGRAPADVIFLSELAPSKIVAPGWLEPIDDIMTEDMKEDLVRWELWRDKEGNLVGVVFYNQLVMMDYDAKRLKEAGFDEPPNTWDDFYQVSLEIKERGVEQYPIVFSAYGAWTWFLMALSMGDRMFDEDLNPTFDQPDSGGMRAMRMWVEFHKKKLIHPDLLANVSAHETWWAGVGVFHQGWEGCLRVSNDPIKSKHAPNCKYMLLPDEHWTWILDAAVGVSKFSKKKEAAKELVKVLVSPEVMIDIWNSYGVVPARKSVKEYLASLEGPSKLEGLDVINEQAKYFRPLPGQGNALPYAEPWFSEFTQKAIDMMIKAGKLEISPEEAVRKIAEEVRELKKKYGE